MFGQGGVFDLRHSYNEQNYVQWNCQLAHIVRVHNEQIGTIHFSWTLSCIAVTTKCSKYFYYKSDPLRDVCARETVLLSGPVPPKYSSVFLKCVLDNRVV